MSFLMVKQAPGVEKGKEGWRAKNALKNIFLPS